MGPSLADWLARDFFPHHMPESPIPTGVAFLRQEQAHDPDINDGVRVNLAPSQKCGLLAAKAIAAKDVAKAISDRAEWWAGESRAGAVGASCHGRDAGTRLEGDGREAMRLGELRGDSSRKADEPCSLRLWRKRETG